MITTRESINYQFSLIFGYSSPGDIIVGDVIGPGKLTKKKVNTLSEEVISFLRMFNAILRDYTGSELYSIEYELYNYDSNQSKIKIYPKSMILMPGRYKDCETLLLALKPELGFLNIHKSRDALNDLGKLFFEVEEFSNHPKLSKDENKLILQEFASRFSLKLFGELIENKWNKKLVGISSSLPTDKEMLDVFGSIVSNVVYSWDKEPIQVRFENSKFLKVKDPLQERASIDHLAYTISKPSANYIVNKSLELGKNLIALANTGTIDETKEKILIFISRQIKEEFNIINDQKNITFLLSEFYRLMDTLEKSFSNYLKSSREFIYSGQYEKIEGILQKFKISVLGKREYSDKDFYRELNEITIDFIMQNMQKKTSIIRASDLESSISYFSEIVDAAMVLVKQSLPIYLSRLRLRYTCANLISNVKKKLELEKKPVKVFGHRFLNDLQSLINKSIELSPLFTKKTLSYDDKSIIREFKRLVNDNLSTFFDDINLNISDVVSFVEVQMDSSRNLIRDHIEKFKTYSVELSYLLSYILRYSTINRFLKEHPEDEISDPVTFSNKFYRFLEKRVGGIQLNWKQFVLEWTKD